MNLTKNNKAFTLVELIVVIVILAILATIAFLSFSSQSGSARDSTRLSDISSIKKSVEMYNVNAGTYPTPDYAYSYTYSGGIIWNQGTIGDSAYKMLQKNLSKKVVDPLKGSEYDYSLASNKREYQVAGNFENPTSFERSFNPFDSSNLNPKLSALGGTGANVYISGNYNGVMLKVFTGSTYYFVPTPTLFGIGTGSTVYDNTFGSGKDLLPGVNNAAVFDSSKVYASTSSTGLSATEVESLMVTIQSAYLTGNVTTPAVQEVLAATGSALTDLGVGLVKNSLGGGAVASGGAGTGTVTPPTGAVFPWNGNTGSGFSFSGATPTSCADLLAGSTFKVGTTIPWNGSYFLSGSYLIDPDGAGAVPSKFIYCDMTSDGGGWTLLAVGGVRDSRYCSTTGFGSPSPASSYSVGTTYMPAPGTTRTYRNSIDGTTFSSGISILNTSNSNGCMILDQTGIGFKDPTGNGRVFLFNGNWEGCHGFYYGGSCDSYTNNGWLYVK